MAADTGAGFWTSVAGMALCLFGLGLGWNLSYVAATTELVGRAAPSERGRLVGATDLAASLTSMRELAEQRDELYVDSADQTGTVARG